MPGWEGRMVIVIASILALLDAKDLASGESSGDAPFQVFGGPTFEAFATAMEAVCPKVRARFVTAGDLAKWEEDFADALPKAESARVPIPRSCERYNGLSCPASANLEAISKASLMDRFVAFVCTRSRRNTER